MNRLNILDCTLRDGGYINEFHFGEQAMKNVIEKLSKAAIDIIECGFMKSGAFDKDKSLFGSIDSVKNVIGEKNPNLMYVAMIQYGAISIDEIEEFDGNSVDGIRLTFHEHEIDPSFVLAEQLMGKGYKVFMQPVGTMTYTDAALLKLIERVNRLKPYAFYMVDTLGTMYKNDLLRMFYLVDHNLDKKIAVGFHSHNNLQLSFSNAQELMQLNMSRRLIIDVSVFGMGRGAGNLNTELVTQYINSNFGLRYDNIEILEIIDEYIQPLSIQYRWVYEAAYYIASVTGCHPNYASILLNRQTLHVQDIYAILNHLDIGRRMLFDRKYINEEYLHYMSHHVDDREALERLKKCIAERPVLLLAPGKSLKTDQEKIMELLEKDDYFAVSVNFIPSNLAVDMMFVSNMKRFRSIEELGKEASGRINIIATSNISTIPQENRYIIDYSSYLNEEQCISDNAGLMCINLLKKVGVKQILLAGFDGFSPNLQENYYESSMYMDVEAERLMKMNIATARKLEQLSTQMEIRYLTDSVYQS